MTNQKLSEFAIPRSLCPLALYVDSAMLCLGQMNKNSARELLINWRAYKLITE